jgi:transposase
MAFERQSEFEIQPAAIKSMAPKIGCGSEALWARVLSAAIETGRRDGIATADRDQIKALERGNSQFRQANEILKKASAYFTLAKCDRPFRN